MNNYQIEQRIKELIDIIYTKYNSVGGALHIVLDDDNWETEHIQWCLDNSVAKIENEEERQVYKECAELLLKLSYSARRRLLKNR